MFCPWQTIGELRQPCLMRAVPEMAMSLDGVVGESILRSIDETLWEWVERRAVTSLVETTQADRLYTTDKWLTTSALQKCIRRGHTDLAERYARSAVRIDADHAFRRLAVIALEDVGLGDLKLTSATLAVLGDKRRRFRLGEERLAGLLARKLSRAVKSRLACEMLSTVEYDRDATSAAAHARHLEEAELITIIAREEFASTVQMISLLLLYGTKRLTSRAIPNADGFGVHSVLRLLTEMRVPLIFHYIVRNALRRCRDNLALPFVLIGSLPLADWEMTVARDDISPAPMIGPYPSFAYDMHTRTGRAAIQRFKTHFRPVLEKAGVTNASNYVFAVEGGLLNQRLSHPIFDQLRLRATRLEIFGRDDGSEWELASNLKINPILDDLRRQVGLRTL